MEILIAAMIAMQLASGPAPGTYTTTADKDGIIRTDTRTGKMERCSVAGNVVTCAAMVASK